MSVPAPPTAPSALQRADILVAAELACLLEASAPKPGNVSPGRHFGDARYEEFLASAVAIGAPLADAGTRPLGETVRLAVEATARWVRSNTNLGIVLLIAPLARAALLRAADHEPPPGAAERIAPPDLRTILGRVLDSTTIDDARNVYAAIRRAAPGGLGHADDQDVANEPTLPLVDVMRLAAARDGIAREYATSFAVTFEIGAPALERARGAGLSWDDAVVEAFLTLLAERPDTHIVRRAGEAVAADVSRQARTILEAGGPRSMKGRQAIEEMDRRLRDARNTANPGTTADLTAASIFVVLIGGGWTKGGSDAAAR